MRKASPRGFARRARRPRKRYSSTLDARALEAVGRFVRVLARCGCTPEDIGREVLKACRQVPGSWARIATVSQREMDDAAHLLTLWFSDPAYLDARGNPRPLPLRGAGGSLEALAHRVDPKLEARDVLRYLSRHGALRRSGRRYWPKERVLSLRGTGGPDNFRNLRGLVAMLRTLEHNGQPKRRVPGWFEVFAENPRFPVSARAGFDRRLRTRGNKFLYGEDADMLRCERARKPGERTVRIGVGVFRFEEEPVPALRHGRISRTAHRSNPKG